MDFRKASIILESSLESLTEGRLAEASEKMAEVVRIPTKDPTTATRKAAADIIRGTRKVAGSSGKHQWVANHMLSKLYKDSGASKRAAAAKKKAHADTITADEAAQSDFDKYSSPASNVAHRDDAAPKKKVGTPTFTPLGLPKKDPRFDKYSSPQKEAVKTKMRWLKRNPKPDTDPFESK